MRLLDELDAQTVALQQEADTEVVFLLENATPQLYRRFLARVFSFVSPLERSLSDTPGLEQFFDARRLRKHSLLQHDLQVLGLRPLEVESLPQCMWIPWFDNVHDALGWAYIVERTTLAHAQLFRQLASVMPGEIAFASSYLKCYFGSVGEMWRSFGDGLDAAARQPTDAKRIIDAARTAFRHQRRWRNTLDGKASSGPQPLITQEHLERASSPDLERVAASQLSLVVNDD